MTTRWFLIGFGLAAVLSMELASAEVPKVRLDALGDPLPMQATHRFGTSRLCTQAEVTSLAISLDGKILAAADRDGRGYVWDARTGKERVRTNPGIGKRVAIAPNGHWLALGDEFAFEVRNLRLKDEPRLQLGAGSHVFAFGPDSTTLAVTQADASDVFLYDLESGKELRRFMGLEGVIAAVAISGDGKLLAAAAPVPESQPPTVHLVVWDVERAEKRKEWDFKAKQISKLLFLPDNKVLIGHFGARLAGWNAITGEHLPSINHGVGSSFALDRPGKVLASSDGPKIADFTSRKVLHEFEAPALIRHLALSGDGTLLAASASRFDSGSPRIFLWDVAAEHERFVADGHRHFVDAVAFSHDGRMIATASNAEGIARVWDARSTKLIHTLRLDSLTAKRSGGPLSRGTLVDGLAFADDRPELYIAGQRWDLKSGEPIPLEADDDFRFEQTNSYRAVITPDARRAASFLSDQSILFWDPAKAKTIQKIQYAEKDRGQWFALAFTPDGKFAATGKWFPVRQDVEEEATEDTIHIWDVTAGKRVKSMRRSKGPVMRLMLSPDAETLAVISFPTKLELWHLPTGRLLRIMPLDDFEEMPRTLVMPAVAFASHGQWIALTHRAGEITLLETQTGKEIETLHGHQGTITSLAFAPDSRNLLSGGKDTTALLWTVAPERVQFPASWKDSDKLWQELGGQPEQAYRVVWGMIAQPERAVEVLGQRLRPDGGAPQKEIRELITNLSSARFAQRDVAMRRLKEIGTRSLPALEQALKKAPDLETSRRIQELLKTVEKSLTPDTLRDLRGLQVLELIATPTARALLTKIGSGDPDASKTQLAQAALDRLKRTDAPR